MTAHTYATSLRWAGSTGVGYDDYSRSHSVAVAGKTELALTADRPFRGNGVDLDPEDLLLAAASSCQLLSFLAVCARARVDVVGYSDNATASMPEGNSPMWVSHIELRPVIELAPGTGEPDVRRTVGRLPRLVEVAHRECFIAASLRSEIAIHATVRLGADVVATFTV